VSIPAVPRTRKGVLLPLAGRRRSLSAAVTAESSNPVLPHVADRRPAMWPWLLMPLVALLLFVALYWVRESASKDAADGPAPISAESHSSD
jgi:hypothetical protein